MKLTIITILLVIITFGSLTGCKSHSKSKTANYQTITGNEAYEMIKENKDITILDVRTESEYNTSHIPNALLLPYDEISEKADSILSDKDNIILIYCRSGRRSAIAASELSTLGYTNVYDFGGINDWNYEVE